LTVHGLDHERAKWRLPARRVLGTAHWMSGHVPDATVAVSRFLVNHYAHCHHRYAVYIPNGVDEPVTHGAAHIEQELGLAPGSYVLFVGRLVPEKAPDQLIRAFRGIPGDCKLVLAGGSSFTDGYVARLRALAAQDRRILFTGYTHGELLAELYSNAAAFVLPSLLEGLPLTLLEAASYGVPVVASDIPPHIEVLGCDGCGHHLFPVGDESALFRVLCHVLEMRRYEQVSAQRLRQHVLGTYRWDRVAAEVEHLYQELVVRSRR
jgi:glycosyltransferase involved in cell wall biosynthesis